MIKLLTKYNKKNSTISCITKLNYLDYMYFYFLFRILKILPAAGKYMDKMKVATINQYRKNFLKG